VLSYSIGGSQNWKVNVGKISAAVATTDGVVVGTALGSITSLAADGGVAWTFAPAGGFSGALAFADDVIYAGSASGAIYALDSRTGKENWRVSTRHLVVAGPAISPSGIVFFGSDAVYGVSSDGQIKWTQTASRPGASPMSAVGTDSVFGVDSSDIGAMLGGDGNFVWSSGSFGKIATIAASSDGTLYVANADGRIFAVK
jgi:outer membrane protein assembly factor BamB